MIDSEKFRVLAGKDDWTSLYAMLDDARDAANSTQDMRSEVHWRVAALEQQKRYEEALRTLQDGAHLFDSKCHIQKTSALILMELGRDHEALDALRDAPFEEEMAPFYALAIDAKFMYLLLLAKAGNAAEVGRQLATIPDDYEHITRNGEFLTKESIRTLLGRCC